MAYVNATFTHDEHEIAIDVLEPTKDEYSFKEGMKINVSWDSFTNLSLSEFKEVLNWMQEKANLIEQTFNEDGSPK